jgi:tripartite-type tricarboxylate transporter receptor subunit TctC
MNRRRLLELGLASLAGTALSPLAAWPQRAYAQGAYPERPIKLVVPFAPGGVVDVVGRLWAEKVKGTLGTVVVENQGGGGGTIGAAEVSRGRPDGYTLLLGNTSTQIINPAIMPKAPYATRDFAAVAIVAIGATAVMVNPSVPAKTLQELVAYGKANPGKLSYGSAGAGTVTSLAGEVFKHATGLSDIVHVPYKGAGPATSDLISGHVPMLTVTITPQLLDLHKTGKIRILSVNTEQRIKAAPDIPTSIEAGVPDLVVQLTTGLYAPPGTPQAILDRLSQATRTAMAEPGVQKTFIDAGLDPVLDSSPDKAQRYVEAESARLLPVIKAVGFKQE